MSKVFVLDTKKRPLAPTQPARARQLLKKGKAAIYCRYPFVIILKREVKNPDSLQLRLKIDPGSKTTGLAILSSERSEESTGEVVWAAFLQHRGQQIKKSLDSRRAVRRSRRYRKTRYRQPRFLNRTRPKGKATKGHWLPPSLMSRVYNTQTWVTRLRNYCLVRFTKAFRVGVKRTKILSYKSN